MPGKPPEEKHDTTAPEGSKRVQWAKSDPGRLVQNSGCHLSKTTALPMPTAAHSMATIWASKSALAFRGNTKKSGGVFRSRAVAATDLQAPINGGGAATGGAAMLGRRRQACTGHRCSRERLRPKKGDDRGGTECVAKAWI